MKTLSNLFIYLILFSFLSLTTYAQEKISLSTKKVEGKYQIDVPDILKEMNDLNDRASLSYGVYGEELYLIVLDFDDDVESTTIEEFYNTAVEELSGSITKANAETPTKKKKRKMEAMTGKLTGLFNNLGICYFIHIVKTKEKLYEIVAWTTLENIEKYSPTVEKVFASFKEL